MAVLFCWFAIILLVLCAVLELLGKLALSSRLLVLFPASLSIGLLFDLSHGARALGQASYNSDLKALLPLAALLLAALIAAFRPTWRWLFWLVWLVSALCCGAMVYLTFFWKVFS